MTTSRRGVAPIEIVTGLAALVVLASMTAVLCGAGGRGVDTRAKTLRDATQLREIHQTLIIFAREMGGSFPRPGMINRHPTEIAGQLREIPGRGEENVGHNTTASLYSALIMQNYLTPQAVVSPVERNPMVSVRDDFDHDLYNPIEDTYWDPGFTADLKTGSNASYAHLPMFGRRMKEQWRDSLQAFYPTLSNRGPVGGEPDFESWTCGPHGNWMGNVCFNDNHVEMLDTMTPKDLKLDAAAGGQPDNIFAMETGPTGGDAILSFTKSMDAEKGPVLQFD